METLPLDAHLLDQLKRLADAMERLAPPRAVAPDFEAAEAFVFVTQPEGFQPVPRVNRVPLKLLEGIERASQQLLDNTERFARGLPANNALLWGARGMGKSSLVKAAHAQVRASHRQSSAFARDGVDLKLVEIHREDIGALPHALHHLLASRHRFIVFCDDLSFDRDDTSYKSLKAVISCRAIWSITSAPPPSTRAKRWRRRCRCRTGSGCGWAFMPARRINTLQWCAATWPTTASPSRPTCWNASALNGP
jgi:predicted AAA+ superfamily ATPase